MKKIDLGTYIYSSYTSCLGKETSGSTSKCVCIHVTVCWSSALKKRDRQLKPWWYSHIFTTWAESKLEALMNIVEGKENCAETRQNYKWHVSNN